MNRQPGRAPTGRSPGPTIRRVPRRTNRLRDRNPVQGIDMMRGDRFRDRAEAGELLAERLGHYRGTDALVLAIPRGGIPVGHAVAKALRLPLDIVLAKKIGHPTNPEFAIGAASPEAVILDPRFDVDPAYVREQVARIRVQMSERAAHYRGGRPRPDVAGRTVIVVDDGVATGHTLLATIDLLRRQDPVHIVVAMPVVPTVFIDKGVANADEFIHLIAPEDFRSVGQFYEDFFPVEDDEATRLLEDNWRTTPA